MLRGDAEAVGVLARSIDAQTNSAEENSVNCIMSKRDQNV